MSKCPQAHHYQNRNSDLSESAINAIFLSSKFNNQDIYVDSGASFNLARQQAWLLNEGKPIIDLIMVTDNNAKLW